MPGLVLIRYDIGLITVIPLEVAKTVQHVPGFYSGIFILFLRHNLASKKAASKGMRNNILFYALCLLYFLSMATIALDFFCVFLQLVSKNEYLA